MITKRYRLLPAHLILNIHKYTGRPSLSWNQPVILPHPSRCYTKYAASSVTNGRNGVEANPAPHHHCPWNLPAASRKSLHLEKRVPGCDGEVRGVGLGVLLITNGSLLHNTSFISSWSWENIAVWPRKQSRATSPWLLSRRNIGPGRTAHIPKSSNGALLTSSSHGEINLISVTVLLFIVTSTTTSTQTRPNGRR